MIVFITECETVKYKEEGIILTSEEGEKRIHCRDIEVIIFDTTRTLVSVYLLIELGTKNIPVIFCDKKHLPKIFTVDLFGHYTVSKLLKKQINWDEQRKIEIWKKIIYQKINNQKTVIEFFKKEKNEPLESYLLKVDLASNFEDLNKIEAITAKIYFVNLFGENFNRRKEQLINSSLNYGYSLIRSYISTIVVSKGLHPSLGICHRSMFNEFNLSDDIIEVFRPMVDYGVSVLLKNQDIGNETQILDLNLRKDLLLILTQDICIDNKIVSLKRGVELYIDSIIKNLDGEGHILTPTLDIERLNYE